METQVKRVRKALIGAVVVLLAATGCAPQGAPTALFEPLAAPAAPAAQRGAPAADAAQPASVVETSPTSEDFALVLDVEQADPEEVMPNVLTEEPDEFAELDASDAVDALPLDNLDERGQAATGIVESDSVFQTVGVSWLPGGEAPRLQLRARNLTGEWTGWFELKPNQALDGSQQAKGNVRLGTDPIFVGDSNAVQVATVGSATNALTAHDVQLTLIDARVPNAPVGYGKAVATQATFAETGGFALTSLAFQPGVEEIAPASAAINVIRRSEWGAQAPRCTWNAAPRFEAAVVHHTAGSNPRTQADVAAVVRGIQSWHRDNLGWCDIGYHFLVDQWGRVFEGAEGTMTRAMIAAHTAGFNTGAMGIAMIGNFHEPSANPVGTPTAAMLEGVGRIAGWRLGIGGVAATGNAVLTAGSGTRWAAGTRVTMQRVSAHGELNNTSCPGSRVTPRMATIRGVASVTTPTVSLATAEAVTRALYADLLGRGADPSGMVTWPIHLMLRDQVDLVRTLTRSEEYVRIRVRQAYREVLRREPEPGGWDHWTNQVLRGALPVDDVQWTFFLSQEFYNQGGGTDAGYVRHLYRTMLGRDATNAEVEQWTAAIRTRGRDAVTRGVWFSLEAAIRRTDSVYQLLLGRKSDWEGVNNWARHELATSQAAVREGMAGSLEYRNRAISRFPSD